MISCMPKCRLEEKTCHPASSGPVADEEFVCRGAIDPDDVGRDGIVKPRFIPNSHFMKGKISVWRVSSVTDEELSAVAPLVTLPAGKKLDRLLCIKVDIIRGLGRQKSGSQQFCVLDECEVDKCGNAHPQHAHVSSCRKNDSLARDVDDPEFQAAIHTLRTVFMAGTAWKAP